MEHRRITQARAWLLRESVWIGALALRLEPKADPTVDYMATDGRTLRYNPAAIKDETTENIAGVIAHETAHCVLGHFARRGNRDPEGWNIAADYAANALLQAADFKLPRGALIDPKYSTGWSAERIYADRAGDPPTPQEQEQAGKGRVDDAADEAQDGQDGNGDGQDGNGPDAQPGKPGSDPAAPADGKSPAQLADEWTDAGAESEFVAQARGDMPGELARALTDARTRAQDWKALLRDFCQDPARNDFRWTPPNRRHVWRGTYLPGVFSQEVGTLACALDTSGSITDEQIAAFLDEARAMLDSGIVAELVLIACDADADLIGRYRKGDTIDVQRLPGGGGTDFRPVFDLLDAEGITPTACAYITDLAGMFPQVPPAYPVLWIATEPGRAPFGTTVQMEP